MRSRDIVGKRVVRVHQTRFKPREHSGEIGISLDWVEFDDETVLSFYAAESDVEPYVTGTFIKKKSGTNG